MSRLRNVKAISAAPILALALGGAEIAGSAEPLSPEEGYNLVADLVSESRRDRRRAAERLVEAGDLSLAPGIVDALFFIPRANRGEAVEALRELTGAEIGSDYGEWVEYMGSREAIEPKARYVEFKATLLARIDPDYRKILYPEAPSRIRLQEVVWGGVPIDGIPPLERPAHVPADEAGYLADDEQVFGVSAGGEHRAYPVSVLSWHEMLNDEVGGEPLTLSYCTLCGSGILYSTRTAAGGAHTFGTSGLLYRSNKLMYDRETWSLWSNLTGEPVVGRLGRSPIKLEVLPMTLTTWKAWREMHPRTTALAMDDALKELGRRHGYRYRPGAADAARRGVSFPVWQRSDRLPEKEEIYALRLGDEAKAYPLTRVLAEGLVHDTLGGTPIVLVADGESGAVRAYRRGGATFSRGEAPGELVDDGGSVWRLTEEALVFHRDAADSTAEPPRRELLPRVPGHNAFWFGWYAFYPETKVYD